MAHSDFMRRFYALEYRTGSSYQIFMLKMLSLLGVFSSSVGTLPMFSVAQYLASTIKDSRPRYCDHSLCTSNAALMLIGSHWVCVLQNSLHGPGAILVARDRTQQAIIFSTGMLVLKDISWPRRPNSTLNYLMYSENTHLLTFKMCAAVVFVAQVPQKDLAPLIPFDL